MRLAISESTALVSVASAISAESIGVSVALHGRVSAGELLRAQRVAAHSASF
jgi:hypothetical protein